MTCACVDACVQAGVGSKVFVVRDELGDPIALCTQCFLTYGADINRMCDQETYGPTLTCWLCILEWDAAHEVGYLEERILNVQRRRR